MMARLHGMPRPVARERAEFALAHVGMSDRADRRLRGYSKGMRQRIKLAQALVHDPDLLIVDEPLNGVDPVGRRELMDLFRRFRDQGRAVLVSSHILDEMETLAVDSAGALYVAGQTNSIDYPVTPGAIQPAHNGMGQFDAFVAKLNPAGTAFEYVTYLGGSQNERAHIVRVDAAGNAYVAGETDSVNFPTSAGAAQTTSGGAQDVFVAKLNPTGTALLYSTYLGGAGGEPESTRLGGLVIDASGDVIIYGDTNSLDFPTSPGAPQTTRGNPNALQFDQDAFLTRINADGTAFVFSTYLGGSGFEETGDPTQEHTLLEVDAAGTAWIAGTTESADFPASAGAFDATFGGGLNDGFVAHIDTSAGSILYSTYIGGAGDDMVMSLDTDSAGNAYVAIETTSGDFPTTPGSADTTYAGGGDIGVVKLNAAGSALVYGTLLGDGVADTPRVLRVDATGRAYIAGETRSTIIATPGAADTTFNGGLWDGFIARLNAAGTAFDFLGDGVAEAMYADETTMWTYDGVSGMVVVSQPRSSWTNIEYPVVADVDNDGSAEILVVSNQYMGMTAPTIEVFRDAEDRWIQPRRIWNQHTYHVTNVREDGTIPQYEPKSWELLNTFRTNAQVEAGGNCEPPVPR